MTQELRKLADDLDAEFVLGRISNHNGRKAAAEIRLLLDRLEKAEKRVDALLQHCPDSECLTCGGIICPHGEPMHFHHDGCPACAQHEAMEASK